MKLRLTAVAASLLLASIAMAQPSVYFLWKNKAGQTMCNPDAPDPNWVKVGGPFQDSNCSIPEKT